MTYEKQLFADSDNVLDYTGLTAYDAKIKEYLKNLMAYPVGYIYETMDADFNPNDSFTGTWEEITDRFLKSSSTEDVGTTGGETTHRLTVDEMASHRHPLQIATVSSKTVGSGSGQTVLTAVNYGNADAYTSYSGGYVNDGTETMENNNGGVPFSIVPNYIVVKMWRRTA